LRFPVLCSNIVKILLFRDEEKLACYLTAYYEIRIFLAHEDTQIISRARENL